jgi:hypothetical protein
MSAGAAVARAAQRVVKRAVATFEVYRIKAGKAVIPSWWRTEGHVRFDYQSVFYHRFRLTNDGKGELACLDLILAETIGRFGPGSERFSRHILYREFAAVACLAERAAEKAIKGLCDRGIIQREGRMEDVGGTWAVTGWGWRPLIKQWPTLPDYTPPPPPVLELVSKNEEDTEGEEEAKNVTEVRDLPPVHVRAGRPSPARKLFEGLKHRTISNREVEVRHRIYGSELIETFLIFPEEEKSVPSKPPGHIKDGLNGHAPPQSSPDRRHGPVSPGFQSFLDIAVRVGLPSTREFIADAERLWNKLPVEEQMGAMRMMRAHEQAGTFQHVDLTYWQIDYVVKKRKWELPVHAKKLSKAEQANEGLMNWAREMDRKMGR